MKVTRVRALFVLTLLLISSSVFAKSSLSVTNLRTEYKQNPIGIDVTAPRFSWEILSDKQNTMQTQYEIRCALASKDLSKRDKNIYHVVVNTDQSVHVEYIGIPLKSRQRVYWQVRIKDNYNRTSKWSKPGFFEMALLSEADWKASWVETDIQEDTTLSNPAHFLRKEFKLEKSVRKARLYITSHGLYQSYINSKNVTEQVLTPGWTTYKKRLQYQIYDVTKLLSKGSNAIGIALGDGWYRGNMMWKDNRNLYGTTLATLAQLEVEYTDGSKEIIVTDGSWKSSNEGPILKSDIYNGEAYDARKEMEGWASIGFNASKWKGVKVKDYSKSNLVAPVGPPVMRVEEIKPIGITPKENGKYIVDMGQNMVGWIRLKVKGSAGTTVQLKHVEVLDKYGEIYTTNLRTADQLITYTCKGEGEEIYEPHFTFQGFRFVEVSGYPGELTTESLTGVVVHSDMTPTGTFVCSDSLLNQLQHNIKWGLKGNFVDVPTDCPQRDERLGWTGDAQVFAPTACFIMDAASFYTKWLKDLAADQNKNGKVGDVIPNAMGPDAGGHTGWADAALVVPWTVYLNYGDKRILEEQYESMKAWVDYMREHSKESMNEHLDEDFLWKYEWHYGDWLSYDVSNPSYMGAYTAVDLIATAYFAYSTDLLARSANILGKKDDVTKYSQLYNQVKKAFQNEYITANGRLVSDTQTAYVLALSFGLFPESMLKVAEFNFGYSVNMFKHITTGFLGTPRICQTLSDHGMLESAYMLLNRKEYPSWLYPVTMGATTIWERWDGQKPDSTFQDPGMNSFNHYAYGAIGKWMYSTVAGIDVDEKNPGYKNIIIAPQPGGGLTKAKASINTIYGKASTGWVLEEDVLTLNIIIPPNTTAKMILPTDKIENVTVKGKALQKVKGFEVVDCECEKVVVKVGSGEYELRVVQ